MGDNAQGRDSGDRGASALGSQPVPSGANFQTQRARARAGAFAGKSQPGDSISGGQARAGLNATKRNIGKELVSKMAKSSRTGNDPSVVQQPTSRPSPAERISPRDGGHRNPQK